jgi:hypothetical protein
MWARLQWSYIDRHCRGFAIDSRLIASPAAAAAAAAATTCCVHGLKLINFNLDFTLTMSDLNDLKRINCERKSLKMRNST